LNFKIVQPHMSMKTTLFFDSSGEFWTICKNMIQQINENEEDRMY